MAAGLFLGCGLPKAGGKEGGRTALSPHLAAWEMDYARRGALWRQRGDPVPEMGKGWKVLELGCGNGKTTAALSLQPIELHAIDASPTAVEMCRECVEKAGGRVNAAVMDGLRIEWPADSFDAVVAFHYLAHMPSAEREKAGEEAARVLKPGGRLFFKEFGTGDFRFGKGTETEHGTFRRRGGILTHYFTEEEVRAAFPALELESLEFEKRNMVLRGREFRREKILAVFSKPGGRRG